MYISEESGFYQAVKSKVKRIAVDYDQTFELNITYFNRESGSNDFNFIKGGLIDILAPYKKVKLLIPGDGDFIQTQ